MSVASGSPVKPASSTSSKKPLFKSTVKKPISKKPTSVKAAAAKTKASPKAKATQANTTTVRPSWKDIIKECIAANKVDARQGVSRNTIKRYAEEAYKIDVSGSNLSQLNRAITSGVEGGIFILPRGPSGKVKLAPKAKPLTSASKENSKPAKATTTKKVTVALPATKAAAAPKKVLAGKVKSTTTTKKTTAPSKQGAVKKVRDVIEIDAIDCLRNQQRLHQRRRERIAN